MNKKDQALIQSLDYYLKDFRSDEKPLKEGHHGSWRWLELEKLAPLPYMVFICLVVFKGFNYWGKDEKVLWEIPIRYKRFSFLLSHRKSGFEIESMGEEPPQSIVDEMVGQLNKAIGVTDKLMQPCAKQQMQLGNVTVANRYIRLGMRYRFFRKKAREAFMRSQKRERLPKGHDESGFHRIVKDMNYKIKVEREGSYYAVAMVDAYFSRLEHLLVIVIPFTGFDCNKDRLIELISALWSEKFKRLFDLRNDKEAKRLFDRLGSVKEKYRNPITHGNFEKGGTSLYFHFKELGAIPVSLSSFKDSIYYSFLPINIESYREICSLFDEVDDFLKRGKTKYGVMFAESGLDVAFSKDALAEYSSAIKLDSSFKSFIKHTAYIDMIYTNMDFPMLHSVRKPLGRECRP